MKLSQKLLALSGVAFADYACCPYDDYGIPSDDCGISEKTPFSADDSWNGNSCKAWEANVDASFDGNDNDCTTGDDNWSSCGFQRHFSWIAANNANENQQTGAFVLRLDSVANGGAALLPAVDLDINGGGTDSYTVGGSPWHQGVCKLFIPVPSAQISSVSIAGVHISGAGPSAFDATVTDGAASYAFPGTAYCFSVVNPAEFLSNYNGGDNYLNNGNVAGLRDLAQEGALANLANDPFDDLTSETARQAGIPHPFFGGPSFTGLGFTTYEALLGDATDATDDSIVKKGANFDVVAHFKHDYCTTFWTKEDMQMPGDWNNNDGVPADVDYPLTGPLHTHTDTVDKRFASPTIAVSFNDYYSSDGATMRNHADTLDVRWPNVGAYAGFYSFVACANGDSADYTHTNYSKFVYMIGADVAGAGGCNGAYGDATEVEACLNNVGVNKVVPSLGNSMWRYECENDGSDNFNPAMRFNIRQAGANIRNCGPGTMPDNDGTRCSWNWNFTGYNQANGNNLDPEGYFHRSNPKSFEVWDAASNARLGNVAAWGSPTALTQIRTITVSIDNRAGNLGDAGVSSVAWENDLPSQYLGTVTPNENDYTFELVCLNPSGTVRDVFPDCFQGEEIHLSATVTYPVDYAGSWTDVMADPWLTTASVVSS